MKKHVFCGYSFVQVGRVRSAVRSTPVTVLRVSTVPRVYRVETALAAALPGPSTVVSVPKGSQATRASGETRASVFRA